MKDAFVAIHGHFYQPPRENPWLEALEAEESAFPFHDWNERIALECYRPNAYARIADDRGRILQIINNYSSINFNFGSTLLPWIEQKMPSVYQRILEADRESIRRFGHGNAIAQTYNHVILPLANDRDKETEVRWGVADFERRFRRRPEAMWLPETAVNYATLRVLADHGMRYLILSPFQALRTRPFGRRGWTDATVGRIDPTQPYRCFIKSPSGKKIPDRFVDLFFYDEGLAKDISFGDLLNDGRALCNRFSEVYQNAKDRPQLVHIATDGETYGHHKKFGEMALAFALTQGFQEAGLKLINYGAFLERFPPVCEVEINEGPKGEGTAWSCSHGVGRWEEDCGCSTGAGPGWNQRWRKPLREALNFLRDELGLIFEKEGAALFRDTREARNDYIRVILDRSTRTVSAFLQAHEARPLSEPERLKGLKLMEMQRHALQMFTSCGWFFADISGLETILILEHAARAIELANELTQQTIETRFLQRLAGAESNLPEKGRGDRIYLSLVKPKQIDLESIVNDYALSSLFGEGKGDKRFYCYRVEKQRDERLEKGDAFVALGKARVVSEILSEPREFCFAVIPFKGDVFRTWVAASRGPGDFDEIKEGVLQALGNGEEKIAGTLTELMGKRTFALGDAPKEQKEAVLQALIKDRLEEHYRSYADLYDRTRESAAVLVREGLKIPYPVRVAAEVTLSERLLDEIRSLKKDLRGGLKRGRIGDILGEAKAQGYQLEAEAPLQVLNSILYEKMEGLEKDVLQKHRSSPVSVETLRENVDEVIDLLDLCSQWNLEVSKEEAQNRMAKMLDETLGRTEMLLWGRAVEQTTFPTNLVALAEKLGFSVDRFRTEQK